MVSHTFLLQLTPARSFYRYWFGYFSRLVLHYILHRHHETSRCRNLSACGVVCC